MEKYKKITKVLIWVFFANLVVALTKLGFGYFLNINSLMADGFHALTDTFSNIIGIIGIRLAAKPADEEHPYGHQKFETIAGLCIGFLLLGIIFKILKNAINWFINPVSIEVSFLSLICIFITIIVNIIVAKLEYKQGEVLKSDVLISDSIHTKSDVFISTGVLISLILIKLGFPSLIDPIISIIIAIFILKSCFEILKMTVGILVDKKVIEESEIIRILKTANSEIIDIHKIRSRGKMDYVYIDLHLVLRADMTVREAHNLAHELEEILEVELEKKVELSCHIEPGA